MRHLILFFAIVVANLSAQTNIEFSKQNFPNDEKALKNALKEIKQGDFFYRVGTSMYKQAIEPYEKAYFLNPNNALLNFKLGKCYLHSSNKLKSIPYLEKAQKLDPNVEPQLHFILGKAYHLDMQWDKAIEEYKKFQSTLSQKELEELNATIERRIQQCVNGKKIVKNPVRVKIENLGDAVNSKYAEYGGVISADESVLIFTSKRNTTVGGQKDLMLNEYFEDIYISNKKDGKWLPAENIGKPVNDDKHNATAGLSVDGQTLYVYIDDAGGDLYETHLNGDKWDEPVKINGEVNSRYHETTASLSFDSKRIYFVSDRPDGEGDRDIYYCEKDEKGNWGKAVNLGNAINTEYGEEGVFVHPDGKTIYFSSQGHNSMGGYDIFKSTFDKGKWSKPENMGYPINTADDDVFFAISASGKHGYYSSVRAEGKGEKDIYLITFLDPEKDSVSTKKDTVILATPQATLLKGVITDAKLATPLLATIEVVDISKNEIVASFKSNSASGKYIVSLPSGKNYGIAVKADGYLFHSENINIPLATSYQEVEKNIALGKIDVGTKIVLNNIFFATAKADLNPESTNELERLTKLMNEIATLKIEISGHTDNVGSAELNQPLSEARAKAVVDYLVSKGIAKSRMVFKGYGFTQPISENTTEQGRQLNRRTEFKILSK